MKPKPHQSVSPNYINITQLQPFPGPIHFFHKRLFLQDLTLPQCLCWGFWSSEMLRCVAGNLTYQVILPARWSFKVLGNIQSTNVTSKKIYIFCHIAVRRSNKVNCLPRCLKFHKPLHCPTYKVSWNLLYWIHTHIPGNIIFFKINMQIEYTQWWHNSWQERELV